MKTFSSIIKPYLKGVVLITLTVGLFELLAGAILYTMVDIGFSDRYMENLLTVSIFKSEIHNKSIYIFLGFGVIALLGVLGFSVYFSHKIAGPLIRMKYFSQDMAEGRYDMKVVFRQGDAVHALAHSADSCAAWYRGKYEEIMHLLEELEDATRLLDESVRTGDTDGISTQSGRLDIGARNLDNTISEIKV